MGLEDQGFPKRVPFGEVLLAAYCEFSGILKEYVGIILRRLHIVSIW